MSVVEKRRDTVGLDSPRDSGLDDDKANNHHNSNNNKSKKASTEFHVVSRRVVDACADLKISLHRRLDMEHVNDRFDEARNRVILNSNPHFSPENNNNISQQTTTNNNNEDLNDDGEFKNKNSRQNAKSVTKFGEEPTFDQVTGGANHRSIGRKLARLQYARNVLITNASPSVTKELFADVPEEWLRVGRNLAIFVVYTVVLLVVPISGLQLDCSTVECVANNFTLDLNHTRVRRTYLRAILSDDCPFDQWSDALFGIWFGVAAAAGFGAIVFVWTIADTFFRPFHAHFKSITVRTVVATISTVPFRIRLFVVVPPLIGMGITGCMIYARLRAEAQNVTWSWGTIAAPAIFGYGLALVLQMWISWKYLNKQNAGGNTARNVLPANWSKLLLIMNALAMTVAAMVSPSVAAKMADCDPDYGEHWDAVIYPVCVFFGVKMVTSLSELLYRVVNGATSVADGRYGIGGGGGGKGDAPSTNAESDDEDGSDAENDDGTGSLNSAARRDPDDEESHGLKFGSNVRPVWQDCIRLITRECLLTAGMILVAMKLHDYRNYGFLDWFYISIPFIVAAAVGFFVSILELRASIQYAKQQFCSLEELLGTQKGKGKKSGSLEESLPTLMYGATGHEHDEV